MTCGVRGREVELRPSNHRVPNSIKKFWTLTETKRMLFIIGMTKRFNTDIID